MSRKIYTYTDLRTLGSTDVWQEIKKYPIITVTKDLKQALKGGKASENEGKLFEDDNTVIVCESAKVTRAVSPKWAIDESKFHETVLINAYIREKIARTNDRDTKNWLIGCRRNTSMILNSIILLEEAGVKPSDLNPNGDVNVELLVEIWKHLEKNDPVISQFRSDMESLVNGQVLSKVFNELFKLSSVNTIVLHGFYYFTPIQERIISAMESTGINLIFLIPYNEKYPYAHEIWNLTYSEEFGYEPVDKWTKEKNNSIDPYGEVFEGRKAEINNKLYIQEYASVYEFIHEIKKAKEAGFMVYSSDPNGANELLKDFYPEYYGERKLLSYPIGQFISSLNKMWDEDLQDIVLDEERLMECFSSGWLAVNGESGKQYLQELANILPFFSDCRRISKWEERIDFLEKIENEVIEPFRKNISEDDSIARWQEIMGNPLSNFSVFSVEREKLDIILKLIKQLLYMAKDLFESDKAVQIHAHITKLDRILRSHEMSNELYEEERELVGDIFTKLNNPVGFTAECFPGDIAAALNIYMSGRYSDGEIQSNTMGMVSPIYMIDAASVKYHSKVHICLCDVNRMPGGNKEYIWPLTGRLIKECYEKTNNRFIKNFMHIMENTYICNRYFMYASLKNSEVQISWVKSINDKLLAPSPYIKILEASTGVKVYPARRNSISYDKIKNSSPENPRTVSYDINRMPPYVSKEAKMDYAICPMKYALGYVVDKYPTFQNDFQFNYAINGLISAIYSLMKNRGMTLDEIYSNVIQLFPALRTVEKRQIYDYMMYQSSFTDVGEFSTYSEIEDMSYTEERLKVRFPNKSARDNAIIAYSKLYSPDGQKGMNFYMSASDVKNNVNHGDELDACLFCQHQNLCRYAVFAVDKKTLRDEEELYD